MKLYKIIRSVIPTMYNHPCKIAIYTNGNRVVEVFQKDFGNWYRNRNFERYQTVSALEAVIHGINAEGERRAAVWAKQNLANHAIH